MLKVLRIYMSAGARVKRRGVLQKLIAPQLSHYLLRAARESGIPQATLRPISAGYLAGHKISHAHTEISAPAHPVCLELVGEESVLRTFLSTSSAYLDGLRYILFAPDEYR
ncbi:TPA: DUF190 domain-containing protein [Pluralibacter gergoviae]|nr:DUF190 domain-containing protein [Pluralibacter gergoviae]MBL3695319.1 DUF190 domain-containing protein [Pluralibacter gergoviae]HDS1150301.1 DUF190 domain-containing protein [Pluralibacter gergoviae]